VKRTVRYRPGVPLPRGATTPQPKKPKTAPPDPALVFHLVRRFALFQSLTGGRSPVGTVVTDAALKQATRDFSLTYGKRKYADIEMEAYLAGYEAMAALLKQKSEEGSDRNT
jgi:hypothetical protein